MISGLLSAVMVLSAAVTPMTAFASEMNPEEELKTCKEQLDAAQKKLFKPIFGCACTIR